MYGNIHLIGKEILKLGILIWINQTISALRFQSHILNSLLLFYISL